MSKRLFIISMLFAILIAVIVTPDLFFQKANAAVTAPDITVKEVTADVPKDQTRDNTPGKPSPDKLNIPFSKNFDTVDKFKGKDEDVLSGFINQIFKIGGFLILPLAVLMIIIQGVRIMIGGLSAETVTEAKNRIVQILTGVALYYMIGFILRTVLPFFFK